MGKRKILATGVVSSLLVMLVVAGGASAAHFGNNRAELGPGTDPDATGVAVVNYSKGQGDFNGNVTVSGLNPGATYTFVVRMGGNEGTDQTICSGTADAQGTFTCSAQHLTLAGFGMAVVEDSAGNDVASGVFARRGNCREPDQAGSQCEAPGQNK